MEVELLNEPWVFPQSKVNARKEGEEIVSPAWEEKTASSGWEEKTASSTWEENFQDLSGWCMDTFQGQCDFHIGESATFKLSGTKYEDNSALPSEEEMLKDLTSVTDEEKWKMKMNVAGRADYPSEDCQSLQTISNSTIKYEKEDDNRVATPNMSNMWVKVPRGTATVTSINMWNKQNDTDVVSIPVEPKYRVEDLDLDDGCPTSFDSPESQRETWDMLRTIESVGPDSFNLLSYLCDDEIGSPEDSIVSTDSSTVSKLWPHGKSPAMISQPPMKVKMEATEVQIRPSIESRPTSTVTSSSSKITPAVSRRSGRTRNPSLSKVEKTYSKVRQQRRGKSRGKSSSHYDSDSDSNDGTYVSNYRESREKNNEASRKSRMNKKAKENEMAMRAIELERDNRILKIKVEELEKLVTSMRSALLKSALKKD